MKPSVVRFAPLVLLVALAVSGCSSFSARSDPQRNPEDFRRIFVQTTFNDNRGTDRLLVAALQARGREVTSGPATMKPFAVDAYLVYDDSWSTNIRDHIESLNLELHDNRTTKLVAYGNFSGPAAIQLEPAQVVARLLDAMLRLPPATAKKS